MSDEGTSRHGGRRSANVAAMPLDQRALRALTDAPVVVHRHGPGRYSVAVVVEGGSGHLTDTEAREALSRWQSLLGGWMTKRRAADTLALSVKMIDALRRNGRLDSDNVHGQVRISVKSVTRELHRRRHSASDSSTKSEE